MWLNQYLANMDDKLLGRGRTKAGEAYFIPSIFFFIFSRNNIICKHSVQGWQLV